MVVEGGERTPGERRTLHRLTNRFEAANQREREANIRGLAAAMTAARRGRESSAASSAHQGC